jgi:hypothetical protein
MISIGSNSHDMMFGLMNPGLANSRSSGRLEVEHGGGASFFGGEYDLFNDYLNSGNYD